MPSQVQVVLQNPAGVCNGGALGRTMAAVLGARGALQSGQNGMEPLAGLQRPAGQFCTAHLAIVIVC
jgi:hypothetical protein